jgi:multiple sugar transport system permease protein
MTTVEATTRTVGRAVGRQPRRNARKAWSRYLFPIPALVYLIVLMIYPLCYTLYLSFKKIDVGNFLSGNAPWAGFSNYTAVFSNPTFPKSLLITVIFTLGSLLFQHAIGFALAVFFNRSFPLDRLLRALLLVGWILPAVVSASLWRWMYSGSYGIINSILSGIGLTHGPHYWLTNPSTALGAVIVANIWLGIPFHMILLHAGLQDISPSVYEASSLDGASGRKAFVHITLPLMRPVMLTTLLLGFVHTFKTFDVIYLMTQGGPADATTVLPVQVYKLSFDYFRFGQGAAAANIMLIIPLLLSIVYLWMRRREEVA